MLQQLAQPKKGWPNRARVHPETLQKFSNAIATDVMCWRVW